MASQRSNSDDQAAKVMRGSNGARLGNESAWRTKPAAKMTGTQQQAAKILGKLAPIDDEDE